MLALSCYRTPSQKNCREMLYCAAIGFLLAPNTVPANVLLSSTSPTLTKESNSEYLPLDFSGCSLQKVSCRHFIRRLQHLQFVDHMLHLVRPSYGSAFVNLVDVPVFPAKTRTHACWVVRQTQFFDRVWYSTRSAQDSPTLALTARQNSAYREVTERVNIIKPPVRLWVLTLFDISVTWITL